MTEQTTAAINRARAARMADHFQRLADVVGVMLLEYEESSMEGDGGADLNDLQPAAAAASYAASLDEWLCTIIAGRDQWREIAKTGEPLDEQRG